jgi:hypothetical protein
MKHYIIYVLCISICAIFSPLLLYSLSLRGAIITISIVLPAMTCTTALNLLGNKPILRPYFFWFLAVLLITLSQLLGILIVKYLFDKSIWLNISLYMYLGMAIYFIGLPQLYFALRHKKI